LAHLGDMLFGLNYPRELLSNGEVGDLGGGLLGQVLHQVVLQLVELVGGLYYVD